jgi:glycine/D-amino acid oxidase-like deaminating enzyme/nitrite reductase/ring-hydroxylating ferredoxin subunit
MSDAIHDRCYWTGTARPAPDHSPLRGDLRVDVAVIGGGIVGVAAARLLKDRGQTVAVVEAGRVGRGVTGRSTAKVTAQHSLFLQRIEGQHGAEAARAYAEANRAGTALIGELVRRHGLQCDHEPADSYVYATTPEGVERLEAERAAAERAGLAMDVVAECGLPYRVMAALRLAGQAQFQPADFIAALAATIPGDGSCVFENSRAIDWNETEVRPEGGTITARQVIMATHLPLGQTGQFYAHTHPHMHAVMAVPVEERRAPAGMHISADEPKRSLRRHTGADGKTVLILAGPRFKHGDQAGEEQGFAELEAFAREHFGYAGGGWRWSNEDYAPRDGLPYVGWSGAEGESLLVATGFDAWGLSNGAAAARTLADLCEGRSNAWAPVFDASRHSLKGLGQLIKDSAAVATDLIGGKLRSLPGVDEAPLEEGALIEIEGRRAGLYRDAGGALSAVSATCSHMGCPLGWNPVDRTWDCPCHGSRFAADGQVIHGPAMTPLEPVALSPELILGEPTGPRFAAGRKQRQDRGAGGCEFAP